DGATHRPPGRATRSRGPGRVGGRIGGVVGDSDGGVDVVVLVEVGWSGRQGRRDGVSEGDASLGAGTHRQLRQDGSALVGGCARPAETARSAGSTGVAVRAGVVAVCCAAGAGSERGGG